ncbi:MAG: ComF family protein, partial [Pseudomonadota bacterium]
GLHTGALSRLVVQFKYSDRLDAQHVLARLMYGAADDLLSDADLIVPVPLHWRRLASRKFNQSAVLAQRVSQLARVPVAVDALVRHKRTRRQVELSGAQRLQNPRAAFRLKHGAASRIAGANVVLIDDVITTGSTVNACARVLRKAGAARIDVLAAAIVDDTIDEMTGTLKAESDFA